MEDKARRIVSATYHLILNMDSRQSAQAFQARVEQSDGSLRAIVLIVRDALGIIVTDDTFPWEEGE